MSEFAFRAYNADGKLETGSVRAASEGDALAELASRGLTAFDVVPGSDVRTPWWSREVSFGRSGVSAPLAGFLRAFALLLDARLPLPDALRLATADVRHKILAEQLSPGSCRASGRYTSRGCDRTAGRPTPATTSPSRRRAAGRSSSRATAPARPARTSWSSSRSSD